MQTGEFWAVELNDPHPQFGGKTVKFPFAFRESAELWAREEVQAGKELFGTECTYRIYKAKQTA